MKKQPPLKFLHKNFIQLKLEQLRKLSTDEIKNSLLPGQAQPLTAKPDGTILEGHHRLKILRERGVNIDELDRVIYENDSSIG